MYFVSAIADGLKVPQKNIKPSPAVEFGRLAMFEVQQNIRFKIKWKNTTIHHFKSDLIHNMDHMPILGTEPSSVTLSQTK